ncbi:acyltransferase family protein [Mesorhizobium sp. LNJC405B00]|uniref:acyltransferase family protein n=1 Tax=unclassified Mesorhizobium TaxID=325217 RepID=UPI000A4C0913|nr:acyltransferase family protein [Mesorhizobium sp. LNJC405B00]
MNVIPDNDHAAPRRIQQYTSIQTLRGLAALMVVIYHLPVALGVLDLPIPILNSGVDLFFVISGFVMVLSTENRHRDHYDLPSRSSDHGRGKIVFELRHLVLSRTSSTAPKCAAVLGRHASCLA